MDASSTIAGNATFSGGHTTVNGGVGSGLLSITGGKATFNGTVNGWRLNQSGGELNGTGTVTATGLSTFAGGDVESGAGTTLAQGGMNLGSDV